MPIQDTFQQPYDRAKWTSLLVDIFPNVSIYQDPQQLEDKGAVFVREFLQLGNVRLSDGKNLAIFEVCVDDKVELSRNRVGLRDLIASKIDLGTTHGVLCVFNSSEPTFRFTFVCKETTFDEAGQIATTETNARKFTYILGPGETRRTAAQRFQELASHRAHAGINEIVEAFSVERLNKEFFQLYKGHYQSFVDHLIQDTDAPSKIFGVLSYAGSDGYDAACKPVRDWVKKLLGRIVFIHFIQKKGWMGCKPSSTAWEGGDPQFLKSLFEAAEKKDHFYSKFLAPLFFEALNAPDRSGDLFDLTGTKVPYLNGGLFDESEEETRKLNFPSQLFEGLLDFFAAYNFTIDENDPEEHEVGIDPEMLGHIFENLLEENKDKGAFYTPKPVVQYMCQQSIMLYLKTHLGDQEGLEKLVRQKDSGDNTKDNWIRKNASRIEELLDTVTICDPAIGSGAFPMGILQEIFWIKLALDWTLNDPAKFAEIKRRIIEHTIHGVDLDAGAVEIARLRCWLSLVVDEVKPRPLPNLEFKIHCADSLVEYIRGEPIKIGVSLKCTQTKEIINNLVKAKGRLFIAVNPSEKIAARLQFYKNLTKLAYIEIAWKKNEQDLIPGNSKSIELEKTLKELNILNGDFETIGRLSLIEKQKFIANVQAWYEDSSKPTFVWRLHFSEIFEKGGFDILIQNPPFIRQELLSANYKNLLIDRFKTYTRISDIFVCFYEAAISHLAANKIICIISSNKWMASGYGKSLRNLIINNANPRLLIDFGELPVFNAGTCPSILITEEPKDTKEIILVQIKSLGPPFPDLFKAASSGRLVDLNTLIDSSWSCSSQPTAIDIIKNRRCCLGDSFKIYRGVLTGFNAAFIIDGNQRDRLINADSNSAELIYPLAKGDDIRKWHIRNKKRYIIMSRRGVDIYRYPAVLEHLKNFKSGLLPKPSDWTKPEWPGRKPGNYQWYEIQDSTAYYKEFEKPKIIYPVIAKESRFTLDTESYYCLDKGYIVATDDLFVLGVLNSRIIWDYLCQKCVSFGNPQQGGRLELRELFVKTIPLPSANGQSKSVIERLVIQLLEGKENENPTLKSELDSKVSELYK